MESIWDVFLNLDVLLILAVLLGAVFERFRLSAVIGYLVAGMIIGPGGARFIEAGESVNMLAELGVALLLFTIGLEFSLERLKAIGRFAILGGSLQVIATAALFTLGALAFGVPLRQAILIGVLIAPSSTACVLRILRDRAEMDSIHGRNATGVLLLQDLALVPLVLIVTLLGKGGDWQAFVREGLMAIGLFVLFVVLFFGLNRTVLPRFLMLGATVRNRELLILTSSALALGAAWVAHALKISPALGAFVAGLMIAGTQFAPQIRADVAPMRVLFVTLFFISIGMLGNLRWMAAHWGEVLGVLGLILAGKALVLVVLTYAMQRSRRNAVATAVSLAQVGEFSFVLAETGLRFNLLDEHMQRLMAASAILSMMLTPLLVRHAPGIGDAVQALLARLLPGGAGLEPLSEESAAALREHFVVVGFGPAGRRVTSRLREDAAEVVVIEMNPRSFADIRAAGALPVLGDASKPDVLEHAHLASARAFIVTAPDHRAALAMVNEAVQLAPHVPVITRARYSQYTEDLLSAGSRITIDEEKVIGVELSRLVERLFFEKDVAGDASDEEPSDL